jgi:hypothetical protein
MAHPLRRTATAAVMAGLTAMLAAACSSSSSTTPSTTTTTTTTTTTPPPCAFAVAPTTAAANGGGGEVTITVGVSAATCTWTATTTASFLTIKSGASGTGAGSVVLTVAANQGGRRSGTVTVAGTVVTVNQDSGLIAQFDMFDPASQPGPTNECRFRNLTSQPTTCTLRSTSFTFDATAIVSYSWNIQYTYGDVKTITGTGSTIDIVDTCGGPASSDDGAANPLTVSLTITDAKGNTATATSGTGGRPGMNVRLYTCGV